MVNSKQQHKPRPTQTWRSGYISKMRLPVYCCSLTCWAHRLWAFWDLVMDHSHLLLGWLPNSGTMLFFWCRWLNINQHDLIGPCWLFYWVPAQVRTQQLGKNMSVSLHLLPAWPGSQHCPPDKVSRPLDYSSPAPIRQHPSQPKPRTDWAFEPWWSKK